MAFFSNADEIFGSYKLKVEKIKVRGWGDKQVGIQALSAGDMLTAEKKGKNDDYLLTLHLIIASVVDEKGNKIFNDSHIEKLKGLPLESVLDLGNKIKHLNKDDVEIEELAKN